MWAVTILAVVALITDLAIHIASFVAVDPREWIQPEWLGLVGLYAMFVTVVVLANVVDARRQRQAEQEGRLLPSEDPTWFKPVMWTMLAYLLFNFLVVGYQSIYPGDPVRLPDGTYATDP